MTTVDFRKLANGADTAAEDDEGADIDARRLNRRELLTYAWGAAVVLLAAESGVTVFLFIQPRFRSGEFGGTFRLGSVAELPQAGALPPPVNTDGKFWLIHSDEGLRALYVVCTHLGCLYKWSETNSRFECPCHGSKFTLTGDYIEGPAPRSLDQFEVRVVVDDILAAATEETSNRIVPPAVPDQDAEIVVETGKRIWGKPAAQSPARGTG